MNKLKVAVVGNPSSLPNQGKLDSRHFNTGNLVHGAAARNILSEFENMPSGEWSEREIDRISSEFSHIVFVAANGVHPSAVDGNPLALSQATLCRNIQKTDLPVVVFGLGVQHKLGALPSKTVPKETLRLLETISDRANEIAVRGHFSAEYLYNLGIRNVRPLGCQSCFYNMTPDFDTSTLTTSRKRKIAFNYTYPNKESKLISMAIENDFSLFTQEEFAEVSLANGDDTQILAGKKFKHLFQKLDITASDYRKWLQKRLYRFCDVPSWMKTIQNYDFSFGTRFHGNMIALQSGVPALWIVHDTRTMELCDYLNLPFVTSNQIERIRNVSELMEMADYSSFEPSYRHNYRELFNYVEASGISHQMPIPIPEKSDHKEKLDLQ